MTMMYALFGVLCAFLTIHISSAASHSPVVAWYVNDRLDQWEQVDKTRITHLFWNRRAILYDDCQISFRQDDKSSGNVEDSAMPRFREYREQYKFKIILMLGGWGYESNYYAHCSTDANRSKLVDNIINYLVKYDFDGVDLDWEHIGIGGACDHEKVFENKVDGCGMKYDQAMEMKKEGWTLHHPDDWLNFEKLIKDLRARFNELSEKNNNRKYLITTAMSIGGQSEGCIGRVDGRHYDPNPEIFHNVPCTYPNWQEICSGLDFLNIMMYDVWGDWYDKTGHHAPLHCDAEEPLMQVFSKPFDKPCEPRFTAKNAVEWYRNPTGNPNTGGCPAEKLLLGLPLYGKGLCDVSKPGLYQSGKPCNDKISNIKQIVPAPNLKTIMSHGYFLNTPQYFHEHRNKDNELVGSYYYNEETKHFMTYDSPNMLYEKTKFAAQEGIGGYFFFDGTMDFEHVGAEAAFAGWYAGKGRPLPEGINLDGEFFQCEAPSSTSA